MCNYCNRIFNGKSTQQLKIHTEKEHQFHFEGSRSNSPNDPTILGIRPKRPRPGDHPPTNLLPTTTSYYDQWSSVFGIYNDYHQRFGGQIGPSGAQDFVRPQMPAPRHDVQYDHGVTRRPLDTMQDSPSPQMFTPTPSPSEQYRKQEPNFGPNSRPEMTTLNPNEFHREPKDSPSPQIFTPTPSSSEQYHKQEPNFGPNSRPEMTTLNPNEFHHEPQDSPRSQIFTPTPSPNEQHRKQEPNIGPNPKPEMTVDNPNEFHYEPQDSSRSQMFTPNPNEQYRKQGPNIGSNPRPEMTATNPNGSPDEPQGSPRSQMFTPSPEPHFFQALDGVPQFQDTPRPQLSRPGPNPSEQYHHETSSHESHDPQISPKSQLLTPR